ncbi:MAG TPA: VOC family protein [Burkholderiales bacterium]|nr:VOC family protein [Burkholderiales bacterium]
MKSKAKRKVPAKKAAPKKKKVQAIPAGYNSVTPYLSIRGAADAIEFYKKAFGAKEIMRMPGPDGKLGHAEIKIGDSRVMLSDEYEAMAFLSPQSRGGTTVHIHLYVKDVDAMVARAIAAGAKINRPIKDQFYGDRTGSIEDPFGHMWHVATHKEDLSKAEMTRRAAEAAKQGGG